MTTTMIYNGCYTLHNERTGQHRTFRIRTATHGPLEGKRIVALLTGSDNESDYTNFAFIDEQGIAVWRRFRGEEGAPSLHEKYARMLWDMIDKGDDSFFVQQGVRLMIEKRCIRCNRKLTHPESIESGIGPECAGRVREQHE